MQRGWLAVCIFIALLTLAAAAPAQTASRISLQVSTGGNPVTTAPGETVITLTATVTAGGTGVSPGQVDFCEVKLAPLRCTDIRLLGKQQLTSGGTATLNFRPGVGTHTYQAVFLGTHLAAGSVSAQSVLVVLPFFPTITDITYPSFLGYGTYTLDVTVTGSGGAVAPTGTVSILDTSNANYVLGTAPVVQGPSGGASGGSGASGLNFSAPVTFTAYPFGCIDAQGGFFPGFGSVAVADFNGDGKLDVAVAESYSLSKNLVPNPCPLPPPDTMNVLLGNGDGTFTEGSNATVAYNTGAVATGDFNGDGKPDLVVATGGNTIRVLLGNGDGTFTAGQTISGAAAPAPTCIATGDFNGDGIEDLAVCNNTATGNVTILQGNGDGTFSLKTTIVTDSDPVSIAVGDLNGDGILDMAVTNAGVSPMEGLGLGSPGSMTVLLGNGDGTFAQVASPIDGTSPDSVVMADFNGDGILDLAVASGGLQPYSGIDQGLLEIRLGNGDGTFRLAGQSPEIDGVDSIAVADFNGDGIADLAFTYPQGLIWALQGNGDGTFGNPFQIPRTNGAPTSVVTADLNGDGLSDIVAPCFDQTNDAPLPQDGYIDVMLPEGDSLGPALVSTATVSDFFVVGTGNHNVVAAYSGDTLYAASVSGIEGLTGEPERTTLSVTANPATSNYQQAVTLTALVAPTTAQNHTATGSVTFTYGTTVVGTSTMVGGIASFTTSMLPAGVDTITANYSGDNNFAVSSNTVVETVNGSQSVTTLAVAPNPALAGQTVNFSATVSGVSFGQNPTGSVTFYSGTTALAQVPLSAADTASYSSAAFPYGSYAITAVYSGDAEFYSSTSSPVALVVSGNLSATALTASPNPGGTGQSVTLTAAVSGIGSAAISTGTVKFFDGTTALGTGMLDATGDATFTTSGFVLGSHSLTAVYSGSSIYFASTSAVYVEVMQKPDFTITLANRAITLQKYQHITTSVTLASAGDFGDTITLACASPPANLTCTFTPTPASLMTNSTATVSFYLDTDSILGGNYTGPLASARGNRPSAIHLALLLGPFSLFGAIFTRRRRLRAALLLLLIAALPFALTGCGGSVIGPVPGVAPGSYTISITGTGTTTGVVHTTQLTLVVTAP